MNEEVKKYFEWIKFAVFFIPLIYAIVRYTNDYAQVPDQMKEVIKEQAWLKEKNRRQDSVDAIHTIFLKQDYDALVKHGIIVP